MHVLCCAYAECIYMPVSLYLSYVDHPVSSQLAEKFDLATETGYIGAMNFFKMYFI